jgi:hypothetical protein
MATRLMTMALPSTAKSSPAMTATSVEVNRRRATIVSTKTAIVPARAVVARHQNALSAPKAAMPSEIIHLPSGGCTTYSGARRKMSVSPDSKDGLASVGQLPS